MLKRDYEGQNCSVAAALEIVGERWTLLIIRDAFVGLSRFEEFRESLGLARNVLTDRLDKLVEHGIFERVRYGDRADRFDYRLTQKGLDLHVALVGLRQWGDKYLCDKPPTVARRKSDKKRLVAALERRAAFTERALKPGGSLLVLRAGGRVAVNLEVSSIGAAPTASPGCE